ncbi:MAG: hypothetical protein FWE22_02415, partial [Firmicutes bacterium]|nr:hypothetical protein [Bacillota bacterium]
NPYLDGVIVRVYEETASGDVLILEHSFDITNNPLTNPNSLNLNNFLRPNSHYRVYVKLVGNPIIFTGYNWSEPHRFTTGLPTATRGIPNISMPGADVFNVQAIILNQAAVVTNQLALYVDGVRTNVAVATVNLGGGQARTQQTIGQLLELAGFSTDTGNRFVIQFRALGNMSINDSELSTALFNSTTGWTPFVQGDMPSDGVFQSVDSSLTITISGNTLTVNFPGFMLTTTTFSINSGGALLLRHEGMFLTAFGLVNIVYHDGGFDTFFSGAFSEVRRFERV